MDSRKFDGERMRDVLMRITCDEIRRYSLRQLVDNIVMFETLIRFKDYARKVENVNLDNEPEYAVFKVHLERTLNLLYKEVDRRDEFSDS